MVIKNFTGHIYLIFTLCERFWLHHAARPHRGHPFVYEQKALIVFFVAMQQCYTFRFKAQHRWLKQHPEMWPHFRLHEVSDRSTLSRHYKTLYAVLQDFIAFVGKEVVYLRPADNPSMWPQLSSPALVPFRVTQSSFYIHATF